MLAERLGTIDENNFEERDNVLRRFYVNDSLAYQVSIEQDSYVRRAEEAVDKFSSFRKRLGIIVDENFDREVTDLVLSMNNVGICCYNPMNFRTKEFEAKVKNVLCAGVAGGAAMGIPLGVIIAGMYGGNNLSNIFIGSIFSSSIIYPGLLAIYDLNSPFPVKSFLSDAEKTEKFVRENKVVLTDEDFVRYSS